MPIVYDAPDAPAAPPAAAPPGAARRRIVFEDEAPAAPQPTAAAAPPPAAPAAPKAPRTTMDNIVESPIGAAELLAQGATGAVANIPAGIAGLFHSLATVLGAGGNPADTVENIKGALTYQPQSESAKGVGEALAPVVDKVDKAVVSPTLEAVGSVSPAAENVLRTAVPAVAEAVGTVAPLARPAASALTSAGKALIPDKGGAPRVPPTPSAGDGVRLSEDPIANMRAAGYKLRPSDVRATNPTAKVPGLRREALQDPAEVRQEFGLHNQGVSTRLAAEDIGASRTDQLVPAEFERLREPHFKTYEAVEDTLSTAPPDDNFKIALEAAKLRTDFRKTDKPTTTQIIAALRRQERKKARSNDVATNKDGMQDREMADGLESMVAERLKAAGNEKLFGEYQAARTALAKLHDVETVTKGGQVDAAAMNRLAKRGVKLSGRLKLIADAGDTARGVMRQSQMYAGVKGGTTVDSKAGAIKAGAKALIRKLPGMDVRRDSFQNKFGAEASETARSYFDDYGKRRKRPEKTEPQQSELSLPQGPPAFDGLTPPPGEPLGRSRPASVPFEPTGGVVPSRAQTLAGDLGLAPEPVPNPVALPEAPSRLSADVPPPTPQGGLRFEAELPRLAQMVDDLEAQLVPPRAPLGPDTVEWAPPNLADMLIDDPTNRRLNMPPTLATQGDLPVDAEQLPALALEAPEGRVGKPKPATTDKAKPKGKAKPKDAK